MAVEERSACVVKVCSCSSVKPATIGFMVESRERLNWSTAFGDESGILAMSLEHLVSVSSHCC